MKPEIKCVDGILVHVDDEHSVQPRPLGTIGKIVGCGLKPICFIRHGKKVWFMDQDEYLHDNIESHNEFIPAKTIVARFYNKLFVGRTLFELLKEGVPYGPDLRPLLPEPESATSTSQ